MKVHGREGSRDHGWHLEHVEGHLIVFHDSESKSDDQCTLSIIYDMYREDGYRTGNHDVTNGGVTRPTTQLKPRWASLSIHQSNCRLTSFLVAASRCYVPVMPPTTPAAPNPYMRKHEEPLNHERKALVIKSML